MIGKVLLTVVALLSFNSAATESDQLIQQYRRLQDEVAKLRAKQFENSITNIIALSKAGDPAAKLVIAELFYSGAGMFQKDFAQAYQLYTEVGEYTETELAHRAQLQSALMREQGIGCPKDETTARRLIYLIADEGFVAAQVNMAQYFLDRAMETAEYLTLERPNFIHSYRWANRASIAGSSEALTIRRLCEGSMTLPQINAAQRFSATNKPITGLTAKLFSINPSQFPKARFISASPTPVVTWQLNQASNGSAPHQFEIAKRYFSGDGLEQNETLGMHWMRESANQKHGNALFFLQNSNRVPKK